MKNELETKQYKTLIMIPLYNQLEYTEKTLSTIPRYKDTAILLVNNGSEDDTRTFCKQLATIPDIFFYDLPDNIGVANAWNIALDLGFIELKADNVLILNNDILLREETIPRMIEDLKNKNVGLISAMDIMPQMASEEEFFAKETNLQNEYVEEPDFSCFGINKECFRKVGYFDGQLYPAYFEDNDYHYRMRLERLKAHKNRNNYYWHYGSKSLNVEPLKKEWIHSCYAKNKEYYIKKWGGEPGKETYIEPFNGNYFKRDDLVTYEQYKKNR